MLQVLSVVAFLPILVTCSDSEWSYPENVSCDMDLAGSALLQISTPAQMGKVVHALPDVSVSNNVSDALDSVGLPLLKSSTLAGPIVSKEQREEALKDAVPALTAAGIQFVASFGTALSIFRDGGLFDEDDDVDFFLSGETFHLAGPALDKIRGDLKHKPGVADFANFLRVEAPDWGPIDLYALRAVNPDKVQGAKETDLLCQLNDRLLMNTSQLFPVRLVELSSLDGLEVPIPNNPEEHLEFLYGKDWRTPKKEKVWQSRRPGDVIESRANFNRLCSPPAKYKNLARVQ